MKKYLLCLLVICSLFAKAQVYNNEWIDYNKTYFKFKVGKTGLYRITQADLVSAGSGLSSTPAEQFQLWRNGVQVPIYTTVASGVFASSDYIEFWGEMNDGKPDKALYRNPAYQLNDKWSLETDTATYFLTVNPAGNNLRLVPTANNVTGNALAAEPYFMHTVGTYFRNQINAGFAVNVDHQYLFSSSYDRGEGWTSTEIGAHAATFTNLFTYAAGPAGTFSIAVSGNSIETRSFIAKVNNDSITGGPVDYFNDAKTSGSVSASLLAGNSAAIEVSSLLAGRMVIHKYELTYPRLFNFGGASNFEFTLPANAAGNYLEINGFSFGSSVPVLYDLTNGKRYLAEVAGTVLKVALEASLSERKLVLVNESSSNINNIDGWSRRVFTNYTAASNQGNYLIISNSALFNGTSGNPVEDYRAYRSSAAGGSYNAKTYLIDELIDQFGFGIKQSPLAIRNFIRYARNAFAAKPRFVFLIGKGVEYHYQRYSEGDPNVQKLDMVPTWGYPGSDNLLSAEPGSSVPATPIGRLSVIFPQEISDYLDKIKETELAQSTLSPNLEDRGWMKNVIHLNGGGEVVLQNILDNAFNNYKARITDTLYGASVYTFTKQSVNAVEQANSNFKEKFENGASLITYFGHSSSGTLSYNIDEPQNYNNRGKYPSFIALGCNAGNFFNADIARFTKHDGLSEKYVLHPKGGMINFIASTHFGIVHYLNIWNERMYNNIATARYGNTIGEAMQQTAIDVFAYTTQDDFYSRANVEELELHGDPAVKVNTHAKPDYLVTDALVKLNPAYISVAERAFKVDAQFYNIGKAVSNKIVIEIKRQFPDQSTKVVYRDTIAGIKYSHAISINLPIDPLVDKGANKLFITVDADNSVDEFYESNNSISKEFLIFEDEARPVYPYNFAIVSQPTVKLQFSTANPFSELKQYKLEVDTTELFNSSFKISKTISSKGGLIELDPGMTLVDKRVYYWRVAIVQVSGEYKWNTASFTYLQNHDVGFGQSHLYQHFKSSIDKLILDSTNRVWKNKPSSNTNIIAFIGTFPYSHESQTSVSVNGNAYIRSGCQGNALIFHVFDAATNLPWSNPGGGLYGSGSNACGAGRQNNFEFPFYGSANRGTIMNFMENVVPNGAYVLIRSNTVSDWWGLPQEFAPTWAGDTTLFGSGRSLYHYFKNVGFTDIDSFYKVRQMGLVYKKGDPSFKPKWVFTSDDFDRNQLSFDISGLETVGYITSPEFGPVKSWKQLLWDGNFLESPTGDNPLIDVIGIKQDKSEQIIFNQIGLNQKAFDISTIDVKQYPYLKLRMLNTDTTLYTPFQLAYWRLTSVPVPEGALAPNIFFSMKDTLETGQPLDFKIAFKNATPWPFDSLKVKIVVTDQNNVTHDLGVARHRPLNGNDTLHIRQYIDTRKFGGSNSLYVEVNPDNDQPEVFHFNNFAYSKFFVNGDSLSPVIDVTFDNVHILNNDIVSSKPEILVKLKDESKWALLNDPASIKIKVRYPDGYLKSFANNSDTVKFAPAQSGLDNTASIIFKPYFTIDGTYELIVSGSDESDNNAGEIEFKVSFQVINKPMISNMLNYPNPFTTSTAFVFTLTGSQVPQNIKIQILTVTGKIVREITKDELGPLQIGRNITAFKWDGTDQYGYKLANGVYLYRVVTNLNGKSLDKYKSQTDNTDQYFNKGYGKMYLMR
jgi:hypothetical protein